MKLSDELRETANSPVGKAPSELHKLLISAADEIDRLNEKLNNKLSTDEFRDAYEKWLDQKYDKERD